MARAALLRGLSWQSAPVVAVRPEHARARRIVLDPPSWPGHRPGQHVDVRLTAPDGYTAQRSYSIASAPEHPHLELVVDALPDGEVSPYLTGELRAGDELRVADLRYRLGSDPDAETLVDHAGSRRSHPAPGRDGRPMTG